MNIMYGVEITIAELEKLKNDLGFVLSVNSEPVGIYANHLMVSRELSEFNPVISSATEGILSFEAAYSTTDRRNSPNNQFIIAVKSTVIKDADYHAQAEGRNLISEDIVSPSMHECGILDDFIRKFRISKNPQFLISL